MELFPAIDLRGGLVVQLVGGDFAVETRYSDDPVGVAVAFEEAGAPWLHLVDLDAARTGEAHNRVQIGEVAAAVSVPVQVGGGVRSVRAAAELAERGVTRVVIGTAAVEEPSLVEEVARSQRVAVGLDVRGREVATRGWRSGAGLDWTEVLGRFGDSGAEAAVVTQIAGEGAMAGPDLAGLSEVLAATELQVVASGGVGGLGDLAALAALDVEGRRLAGCVVGTAIYEGRLDVDEAVRVLSSQAR